MDKAWLTAAVDGLLGVRVCDDFGARPRRQFPSALGGSYVALRDHARPRVALRKKDGSNTHLFQRMRTSCVDYKLPIEID